VPIAKRREQGAVLRYFYAAYNNLPITNKSVQLCAPESGKSKERKGYNCIFAYFLAWTCRYCKFWGFFLMDRTRI
jgi:hypothetical protein